jgi:hypothetical protein
MRRENKPEEKEMMTKAEMQRTTTIWTRDTKSCCFFSNGLKVQPGQSEFKSLSMHGVALLCILTW